ncbi:MAG: hypothetical protein Q8L23_15835 [Caulobacter sp.]|nr:hypothetical protein [Caulobacter sp.]
MRLVTRQMLEAEVDATRRHLVRHNTLWNPLGFDAVAGIIAAAIADAETALDIGGPAMWERAMWGLGAEGFLPGDVGYLPPGGAG